MKKITLFLALAIFVVSIAGCGSGNSNDFSMSSDDTVGATSHTLVGTENCEPPGEYTVVCTKGHGSLHVNDDEFILLAADSYIGKEGIGVTYVESITVFLKQGDVLKARANNSSDFRIEFTYNG